LFPQLPQVGWYCQLSEVVCQNCWLPAEWIQPLSVDSVAELLCVACAIFVLFPLCFIAVPWEPGNKESPPTEPHMAGRHKYDRVLPGALKGSLTTLLSPAQFHAALGMTSCLCFSEPEPCLQSKDVTPPWRGRQRLDFGGVVKVNVQNSDCWHYIFGTIQLRSDSQRYSSTFCDILLYVFFCCWWFLINFIYFWAPKIKAKVNKLATSHVHLV
jgi:hypothetical protein